MRAVLIDEALVTALYDTALYSGDWQPALERFRQLLNSAEASLCAWKNGFKEPEVRISGHVLTPEVREPYMQYYGHIDPKLSVLYRNQVAYLFNDARHFDATFVARNTFYQEYTRALGLRHTLDMTIGRNNSSERFLAAMRAPSQGPYESRSERVFRQCSDHFLRVLKLREKIADAQRFGSLAGAALDSLQIGAVVLSAAGSVVFANRAAEEACGAGEELQLRNGRLTARSAKFAHRIQGLIDAAIRNRRGAAALQVPRALGDPRLVWIAPLPADRNLVDGPGALVLIGEPAHRGGGRAGDLIAIYGLTPAEAELAVAVGSGLSMREAAAKRGVKFSTVRSQMLSVLQKTGARRQADLVRMISSLPGGLLRNNQSP